MDEHSHDDCVLALAKAQEEASQYLNNWKRAKADYANLERQVERRREEWAHIATASSIAAFLPVYESLVHAALADTRDDGLVRIRDQMRRALASLGVEPMDSIGKTPDPMAHEVVGQEHREGVAPGTIIKEAQQGFTLHGTVFRVAKVIVAE